MFGPSCTISSLDAILCSIAAFAGCILLDLLDISPKQHNDQQDYDTVTSDLPNATAGNAKQPYRGSHTIQLLCSTYPDRESSEL
jgi:hypothetical protein